MTQSHPLKTSSATEPDPVALVEIIELKWLMAGEGLRVHVERLQTDRAYAQQTLAMAEASPHSALRRLAGRLRTKLHLPVA